MRVRGTGLEDAEALFSWLLHTKMKLGMHLWFIEYEGFWTLKNELRSSFFLLCGAFFDVFVAGFANEEIGEDG